MISFIVIGRNEGWKLEKCLSSIEKVIDYYKIYNSEIIYVDSESEDASIDTALLYKDVKIYKLTDYYNSAIARNVGAKNAHGEILFFLDGDMELNINNFKYLFNEKLNQLKYPFISGDFLNYYYKNQNPTSLVYKSPYHNINKLTIEVTTGGLFAINKELWFKVGGMRNEFKRSQDLDLGLRLAKIGVFLTRLPYLIVNHHTVKYSDKNRFMKDLIKGNYLYKGLLIRKNIFNKHIVKRFLFREKTLFILILSVILSIAFNSWYFLLLYLILSSIRAYKNSKSSQFFIKFLQNILIDLNTLLGFLLFYPKVKKFNVLTIK